MKRKKKEEAAQPRGTTSKRKAEKPPDAPKKEQSRKYAKRSCDLLAVKPATLGGLLFWRCRKYMSIGLLDVFYFV